VTYVCAIGLALALLYVCGPRSWYWHVLSLVGALAVGLAPMPAGWHTRASDLGIGFLFTFLFVWAVAARFFRSHHRLLHRHLHSWTVFLSSELLRGLPEK
jgi:NhaP-type Na+/H+ or K+/H+ antiporter